MRFHDFSRRFHILDMDSMSILNWRNSGFEILQSPHETSVQKPSTSWHLIHWISLPALRRTHGIEVPLQAALDVSLLSRWRFPVLRFLATISNLGFGVSPERCTHTCSNVAPEPSSVATFCVT